MLYVMEFLEGEPLSAIFRRGRRLDLRAVIDVGIDVGQALRVAHTAGVVHRDVKPDNIFIALGPHLATSAKLIDFGVAWLHDGGPQDSGTVYGTLKYASPEQLRGEPATPLMDIWSLGCVLFEAITGRVPFNTSSALELVDAVLGPMPAPRLSAFAADSPQKLVELVACMLEKNLSRRLSRVDMAIAELRRVQHHLAIAPRHLAEDSRTQETLLGAMDRGFRSEPVNGNTQDSEELGPAPNPTVTAHPHLMLPVATQAAGKHDRGHQTDAPAGVIPSAHAFESIAAHQRAGTQKTAPVALSRLSTSKQGGVGELPPRPAGPFVACGRHFRLRLPYAMLLFFDCLRLSGRHYGLATARIAKGQSTPCADRGGKSACAAAVA